MLQSTVISNADNFKDITMRITLTSKKIRQSDSSQYELNLMNSSVSGNGITFDVVQSTPKSIKLTTKSESKKLRNIKILLQNTSEKPTTIKFLDPLRTAYKEDYRNMQKDTSLVNKMFTSTDTNVYNYQVRTINPIDDDTRNKWGTHMKIPGNNSERYLIKTDAFSDVSEDKKNDFGIQRKKIIRLQSDTTSSPNRYTKEYNISVLTKKRNVEINHIHIEPNEHTFEDQGDISLAMQQDSYLPSSDIHYQPDSNGGIITHRNLQAAKTRIFDYHHLLKGNDKVNYQKTSEISYAQISKHVPEVRLNPTGRNLLPKFLRMNFRTRIIISKI